ncbi:MAG: isoprenylcysteine carboxylmethyltransferase family protein [Nannocystaceae bacterium]
MMGLGFSDGLAALYFVVIVQRLAELRLAAHNRVWARESGAVEYGARHYPLFIFLHTGWIVGGAAEAAWRGARLDADWVWWVGLFCVAQPLRYWAIRSLGKRWNTRVLVFPGRVAVRSGPYRWLRHPNYVAVVLELVAVPMVFGAWYTALTASLLNLLLLGFVRIPLENRALDAATRNETG